MCAEVLVWILQRQKIRIVCQCWLWTMNIIVNISHLKMLCKISDYVTTSMWLGHKYAGVKKRILCLTNTMNHVFEEEKHKDECASKKHQLPCDHCDQCGRGHAYTETVWNISNLCFSTSMCFDWQLSSRVNWKKIILWGLVALNNY